MDTKKLRQKILDLAIRGKLVPQDPNDEPASVLLERILAEKERLIKEGKIKRSKKTVSDDGIEAPFEIPESWEWTNIEAVAESNIGLTYKPSDITLNGIPVYRSNNIQNKEIDLTDVVRVKTDIQTKQYLSEGDLLICARNGSRNLVGKCALIKHLTEPTSFGAFMAVCRSEYNEWIFLLLNSEYFNTYLDESNSTAINQVTQKMLLAFQLPFPPKKEQKRIYNEVAKWFSVIDELENNEDDLLKAIDKAKSKILDLAIHGKLVPQDPNDEPASVLLERIRAEKERLIKERRVKRSKGTTANDNIEAPFEIPRSWEWCRLDDLAFYKKGPFGSSLTKSMFVPDSPNAFKVYEQKNAINKDASLGYYFIDAAKYEELIGFAVSPSDIIVSCAGTIGETYVLPKNIREGIINQALMLIRLYEIDITDFYLLYFDFILKNEASKESKGTAIKNIPPFDVLKNYQIPIPPLAEQKRIVAKIEEVFKALDALS